MKDYTMTQFLNSQGIRDEVVQRWSEIGDRTTGSKRWEILEREYPHMNLPAIRQLANKHINGGEQNRDRFTQICHSFQLSLGHASAKRIAEERYSNGHNGGRQLQEMGPLEYAFAMLDPDLLKVGDVFGVPATLVSGPRLLNCTPKSVIDPFRRRDGRIWEAGWRFEFLNSDYLDYQIKVVEKPVSDSERQKLAEAEKERKQAVAEVEAATQLLSEALARLEKLQQ